MKVAIKVFKNEQNGSIVGKASVVFGESLKVTNIAIMKNSKNEKLFVSMPSYKMEKDGQTEYREICNPITKSFRDDLYSGILETYKKLEKEAFSETIYNVEDSSVPEFSVRVTPYGREGSSLKGLATVFLDAGFVINNISVLEGKNNKLFVSMPSYKTNQVDPDTQKPVCQEMIFPVSKAFREKLYDAILDEYQAAKTKQQEHPTDKKEQNPKDPSVDEKAKNEEDGFKNIQTEEVEHIFGR